jgi:ABC-type uncharacterized transport system involved in gliding motility auxiliary subunit
MSSEPQTAPGVMETNPTRTLIATIAGWVGLALIIGAILYWLVTGNPDLTFRIALILGLLGLGAFGLLNPQGIIEIVAGRGTRNILGTALVVVLGLGILIAINVIYTEIGKRQPAALLRADLTAGQTNSLSPQSIRVAQDLTQTVTVYGFFRASESSAQNTAANLLKEYQKYTNKLNVQMVDPDVHPELAIQFQLTHSSVVIFAEGKHQETAASTSETDFTGALLRLRNNVQKKIAILNIPSPLSFSSGGSQQSVAATLADSGLAKENYIVLPPYNLVVSPTISVKDVDVMIVPPPNPNTTVPDNAVRALSDYLDQGGHVLMIGDPQAGPLPAAILHKYGLTEGRGIIVEQSQQNVWGQSPVQVLVTTYPSFTITRDMNNVPTAYYIAEPIIVPTTTITGFTSTPFIQSSATAVYGEITQDQSGQTTLQPVAGGPAPPYNIGVAVEQTVDAATNYTDTQTTKPQVTRLVVIGDYDFVSDQITGQVASSNLDMFYNTVNWLSQSEERISVRPADTTDRTITMSGQTQNLIAWSTIVFLPVLVLIGGGIVWWRRR